VCGGEIPVTTAADAVVNPLRMALLNALARGPGGILGTGRPSPGFFADSCEFHTWLTGPAGVLVVPNRKGPGMKSETHTRQATHVLVVVNEVVGEALPEVIAAGGGAAVLVVAPALNTRVRHWASDGDEAWRTAALRLHDCLRRLERGGVRAEGRIGDSDPLLAIDDALKLFPADRLVIATPPEARSNWQAHRLVERARMRFGLPTLHVVLDVAHGRSNHEHRPASAA
jgi:hypothetical protein